MDAELLGQAIAGGALLLYLIIALVWYILQVIGYWKVFTKAGEPGWKSIIPFYNKYIQYRLTWKTGMFWIAVALAFAGGLLANYTEGVLQWLGMIVAVAGVVIEVIGLSKLSKSFGHGAGFTAGMFFFQPLFTIILGFGKSKYIGNTTEQK